MASHCSHVLSRSRALDFSPSKTVCPTNLTETKADCTRRNRSSRCRVTDNKNRSSRVAALTTPNKRTNFGDASVVLALANISSLPETRGDDYAGHVERSLHDGRGRRLILGNDRNRISRRTIMPYTGPQRRFRPNASSHGAVSSGRQVGREDT